MEASRIVEKLSDNERWLLSQRHDGTSDFLTVAVGDVIAKYGLGKTSLLGPVWNDLGLAVRAHLKEMAG